MTPHPCPRCTRSFLKTSQGPGLAHNLQTQLQARTTDEGAEAQSCTPCYRPPGLPPCPQGGTGSLPLGPATTPTPNCHCSIHSLHPLGAHTTPGLCLGFPLIMFAILLFPHYLASVAMPPPPGSAPPTPIGSEYWGHSQQINIPLCTALVVLY